MSGQHSYIHRRDVLKAVLVILLGVAVIASGIIGIRYWQRWTEKESLEQPQGGTSPQTVTYRGIEYRAKEKIHTYLMLGVDTQGPVGGDENAASGGQADVQMVLVVDDDAKSWQVLQLNRDSVVDVPIPDITGKIIGTQRQQLALAHAYGDGMKRSCKNAVQAVSDLLEGQRIDGYLALNMDAIPVLNDLVGGVTVTIESDFSEVDSSLVMGQTITLNGEQALHFVRARKGVEDETNLSRMERQRQFLNGLSQKLQTVSTETVAKGYQDVSDYMVTHMGSAVVTGLFQTMDAYQDLGVCTIDGESSTDENGASAYILDETSLKETILQLFYQPVDETYTNK